MIKFHELERCGYFSAFDSRFSKTLLEIAGESDPLVALAAALASHYTRSGYISVPLLELSNLEVVTDDGPVGARWPEFSAWKEALLGSTLVGTGHPPTPLVLEDGSLYLHRYYQYECELARGLTERRHLEVISGGPGTGKTTRVVNILVTLFEEAKTAGKPPPRVVLMAPTGKAATRLTQTIRNAKKADAESRVGGNRAIVRSLPEEAGTIHRILGARAHSPASFVHNAKNPLRADVVVVDEASMVDMALLTKLIRAVPRDSRLFLLGDKHQLAAVEAGAVFGDIDIPGRVVRLTESYRFGNESGIGELAQEIVRGDVNAVKQGLENGGFQSVRWHDTSNWGAEELDGFLTSSVVPKLRNYLGEPSPAKRLLSFDSFRILAAHRNGWFGAGGLNQSVEQALGRAGLIEVGGDWYEGRPVLISHNDYDQGLYNGDVGLIFAATGEPGGFQGFFPSGGSAIRRVPVSRLQNTTTAFAMTVHKAQGSEFDEVVVVLPQSRSKVVNRELLYTGVTRARKRVTLLAPMAVVIGAVETQMTPQSGLRARIDKRLGAN